MTTNQLANMKGYHFDFASNCEVFMNEPFDLRVSMHAEMFLAAISAKFEREEMLKIFQSSSILLVEWSERMELNHQLL